MSVSPSFSSRFCTSSLLAFVLSCEFWCSHDLSAVVQHSIGRYIFIQQTLIRYGLLKYIHSLDKLNYIASCSGLLCGPQVFLRYVLPYAKVSLIHINSTSFFALLMFLRVSFFPCIFTQRLFHISVTDCTHSDLFILSVAQRPYEKPLCLFHLTHHAIFRLVPLS